MTAPALLAFALAASAAVPCREGKSPPALPDLALEPAAEGLESPTHAANAGDGSGRLFVVEQAGRIRVLKAGKLLPAPFLDIHSRVRSGGEKGLLSVAFHPRYRENGRFFVNYTEEKGGLRSVVSEFRADPASDRADPESEKVLFTVAQPYSNHNGGQNAFGPDGLLYVGFGDGGSANDPGDRAQNPEELLGKMLRLDVDKPGAAPEVFARGLRNPWRFSFDPVTKRLIAGDVGQDHWEEIDVVEKGRNYGWRIMEGRHCTPGVEPRCKTAGLTLPVHEYARGEGISVTGGFVYRGASLPALCGGYVFGDYGSGRIWGLRLDASGRAYGHRLLLASGLALSSFGEGEDRELYAVDYGGRVLKLTARAEPASPQRVRFKTKDGWTIAALYRAPKKGGPVAILVHGAEAGKGEWASFQDSLSEAGWGSLAIDLRGHGESREGPAGPRGFSQFGPEDWKAAAGDLSASAAWLARRGVRRLGFVGASIGANLAARAAPPGSWVVLLSPGRDYRGVVLPDLSGRRVLAAASPHDSYARETVRELSGRVSTLEARSGHGAQMLADPDFRAALLDWLRTNGR